jgi:hypothetical protein
MKINPGRPVTPTAQAAPALAPAVTETPQVQPAAPPLQPDTTAVAPPEPAPPAAPVDFEAVDLGHSVKGKGAARREAAVPCEKPVQEPRLKPEAPQKPVHEPRLKPEAPEKPVHEPRLKPEAPEKPTREPRGKPTVQAPEATPSASGAGIVFGSESQSRTVRSYLQIMRARGEALPFDIKDLPKDLLNTKLAPGESMVLGTDGKVVARTTTAAVMANESLGVAAHAAPKQPGAQLDRAVQFNPTETRGEGGTLQVADQSVAVAKTFLKGNRA